MSQAQTDATRSDQAAALAEAQLRCAAAEAAASEAAQQRAAADAAASEAREAARTAEAAHLEETEDLRQRLVHPRQYTGSVADWNACACCTLVVLSPVPCLRHDSKRPCQAGSKQASPASCVSCISLLQQQLMFCGSNDFRRSSRLRTPPQ